MYRKCEKREYDRDVVRSWYIKNDVEMLYGVSFGDFYFDVSSVALNPEQRDYSGRLEIVVKRLVKSYKEKTKYLKT